MTRLSLSLLGPFQVTVDGSPVTAFESDKVRGLLAYLAVEADRPHSRDKLAGLLWPERPDRDARSNLRYALSNLRKAIGDRPATGEQQATPSFLHATRQTIQFNDDSECWVDATAFANLLESPSSTTGELEEAVGLYRGEFLEGFSIGDSVPFEEWVLFKRERLHRQMLSALHRLAATYERRGEHERALPYAWRQVELEPWQEKAHRQLMRLLALNGQRGSALAQYETCRRALAEELGVEPAPETTRLYERIRAGGADFGQADERFRAQEVEGISPAFISPTAERPLSLEREAKRPLSLEREAKRRLSGWRKGGGRLALIGGGLLLLAIATMQAIVLLRTAPPDEAAPPGNIVAPPEGKIVELCEGVTPPQICVYETHTGHLSQVTEDLEFDAIDAPTWSPDGGQIVFSAAAALNSGQLHGFKLYIITVPGGPDAKGSDLRQLTHGDTSDQVPVWSPDGEWIAFNRDRELWIIHPDGLESRRLYGESGGACVGEVMWSPDGRRIAFVGHECTPAFLPKAVWVINRDGTAPRMLHAFERQPDYTDVFWDHNGRDIVCAQTYGSEETRLLLINADGTGTPYLIDELPFWWAPNYWPQWRREP